MDLNKNGDGKLRIYNGQHIWRLYNWHREGRKNQSPLKWKEQKKEKKYS